MIHFIVFLHICIGRMEHRTQEGRGQWAFCPLKFKTKVEQVRQEWQIKHEHEADDKYRIFM